MTGDFQLISEEQGTLYNVGISDIELSSDATKGQGILLRSGETQAFKGTIYARSYDESGSLNVQNFIELPGGGESGGGGGGTPYTLPTMAQNVKGGAKVGDGLTMTGEVLSLSPIYVPSAVVSQTATGAILTVSDHNGTTSASIKSGADGADGETPTISTASIEGGNAVTFGTGAGFWTINIMDGKNGTNGTSPTVAAETITGGNAVTFTSAAGMATINIMDGTPGANGIGVTMTADSIEGGTALKMRSASGWTTVNVMNGKDGAAGADGKSFEIKAQYATEAALIAAHPTGQAGDAYLVGTDNNPDLYVWLSDAAEWQNSGPIAGIVGPKGEKGDPGVGARVALTSIPGGTRATFTDAAGSQIVDIMDGVNGEDGVSPAVTVGSIAGGHNVTISSAGGTNVFSVMDGGDGADGVGVSVAAASVSGGNAVTLTGANGSQSFTILNGEDGESVTVSTETINGGNAVTFTDRTGDHSFNVYNGQNGVNGVSPIVSFATIPAGHVMTVADAQGQKSITIMDGAGSGGSVVEYDCVGVISWQHTLRANCLKLDGATVTASDYPQLLQFVQDNNLTVTAAQWESNCVMYVYDSGNDTLKLPDLTNRVPWGVVNNPRSIEAGLPDATGHFTDRYLTNGGHVLSVDSNGVFKITQSAGSGNVVTNASASANSISLALSNANPIYGNSTTVQPPAAGLIPQVRYASDMLSAVVPLYRKNSQAYGVGDVALSANLPTYLRLQCVTAGTTASVEPSFSGVTAGQYVTDGTAVFIVEDVRDGHLVGEPYIDSILRPGHIRLNGAEYASASTNYPRILKFMDDNPSVVAADAAAYAANKGLWLYDSGTDKLTAPNYIDAFIEGGAALAEIAAGLPNVKGTFRTRAEMGGSGRGPIIYGGDGIITYSWIDSNEGNFVASSSYTGTIEYTFNAGAVKTIYSDSVNTVQPHAIVGIPQCKY